MYAHTSNIPWRVNGSSIDSAVPPPVNHIHEGHHCPSPTAATCTTTLSSCTSSVTIPNHWRNQYCSSCSSWFSSLSFRARTSDFSRTLSLSSQSPIPRSFFKASRALRYCSSEARTLSSMQCWTSRAQVFFFCPVMFAILNLFVNDRV